MGLKRNTIANFIGQLYVTLIGIVILPLYLSFLGGEAYGLVSFFTLLQSWLFLIVAGISPVFARRVAIYAATSDVSNIKFWQEIRSLEFLIALFGIFTAIFVLALSGWISKAWLQFNTLKIADVQYCISLMGVMVGIRWAIAFYASGIGGLEKQIWLNQFNIIIASIRYGAGYLLLRFISNDIEHYFEFQLAISLIELVLILRKFYKYNSSRLIDKKIGLYFSWSVLAPSIPLVLGISYTSVLWVASTQIDKLILSHVLPLTEFGYFSITVLVANGLLSLAEPIKQAISPRLTMLYSHGKMADIKDLYSRTSQYLAVFIFSISVTIAFFSKEILFIVTGDYAVAIWAREILIWFALGNGILIIASLQYVLQYSEGEMRLHIIISSLSTMIQVPILAYMALMYGAVAVAVSWFLIRLTFFLICTAIVHQKYFSKFHIQWLLRDIFSPFIGAIVGLGFIWLINKYYLYTESSASRMGLFLYLTVSGIFVLLCSALAASIVRPYVAQLGGSIFYPVWKGLK